MPTSRQPSSLRYEVHDRPPHLLSAALGFQVVVLILAGIVLTPIIVMKAAGASEEATSWAVFAAILVSGTTTVIQARPIGPVGAGYVLFMGTSGAFIAVSTNAVELGGLALLATLVVLSSFIQFAFSARLSLLRKIITPTVGGTVIMLIAVTVFPICFDMLTSVPAHVDPSSSAGPLTAGSTFVTILLVSLVGAGQARLWGPLIGVTVGCAVAAWVGILDVAPVWSAAWVGLPQASWPGLDLSFDARMWGLMPAFLIVTIVGAIETYGDGVAIQRVSVRERRPVDFKAVQGAVNADGLGNLLSGLAGTLPNTTYSTSISVVELTGVGARRVAVYGGGLMVAIAFLPKVSALLQAVPDAVAGAYILVLLVLLFAQGLRLVAEGGLSYENGLIVCLSFWLGVGFQNRLIFHDQMPAWAQTLFGNGMAAGGLTAMLLTLIVSLKQRSGDRLVLAPTTASVPKLHELLSRQASLAGWDRAAADRLLLAGEEALLFLLDKEEEAAARRERDAGPIPLIVREQEGTIEMEFVSGPGSSNVEDLLRELETKDTVTEEDTGLRILGHLASEVRHEQFLDKNYLLVKVDSKPLA
ncbi:MAG: solute carrier family 23 protein [Thermoanaerobaculia bacterium]|nr:solute carrier family 23 protein [Thermoanaerobaculia bacterium]